MSPKHVKIMSASQVYGLFGTEPYTTGAGLRNLSTRFVASSREERHLPFPEHILLLTFWHDILSHAAPCVNVVQILIN
jgi:hypothetical protein